MRELPELFDLDVKARSLAYLFLAGAGLGVLTLVFPHSRARSQDRELVILAGVATALSVVMYVFADRITTWQLHAFLASGTVILTLANYFVEATVLYPVLYTWTALYAFYFFRLPVALAHVALIAVGYAIVLILVEPDSAVVRWLLAVGTPLIAGLLISRLLTRLRAEGLSAEERARAVQRSEARTRLVLDSAPDAFVAIDRDGLVNSWNAASERLFGWSASEAIGKPLRSLIFPENEREAYDERRRILLEAPEAVKVMRVESELQRRDGSVFPAERTISRVRIGPEVVMTGLPARHRRSAPSRAGARAAPARAGRARRGRAHDRDGQRHAAARGRRTQASDARGHPRRPRGAGTRRARRRRRHDLPRRGARPARDRRLLRRGAGGRATGADPVRAVLRRPRGALAGGAASAQPRSARTSPTRTCASSRSTP